MKSNRQLGLRLDEADSMNLKRIAQREGRNEQDVLRDSLRMYVQHADEQKKIIDSVERGWYELRSGVGTVVAEEDDFFNSIKKELRNGKTSA
ncbi:hypothetical protein [Trichloromonas acetexigens]|uniref:Ribbon-helix-helix protein, CopG family n=1 Tax=Trichloromonas acetexigens TaxID=38815 RepID=A0A550JL06_9BACT|nr:hypothetical protein [Desulfuromonas acetexigens]TRO83872.1 hypothetical protein FL622_01440 [Desulfuromonas acetexigens]